MDEAEDGDAKKEEKKSWTFKKVNKWDGNGLDIGYDREIVCFIKILDARSLQKKKNTSNTSSEMKLMLIHALIDVA